MMKFSRRKTSNHNAEKNEIFAAEFIPYLYHWDKETIILKNNSLMQIVKLSGFAFETADDEDVDMKKMVRNSLLKSMAEGTFALWFHMIRRRKSVYPDGSQPSGFADYVDQKWQGKHHSKNTFVNELYISIIRKPDTEGVAKFEHMFKSLSGKADEKSFYDNMRTAFKELNEAVYRVLATLKDYDPKLLTVEETEYGPLSEPLEFLFYLVNGGDMAKVLTPTMDISRYLPKNRIYFSPRQSAIEIKRDSGTQFASIISIKEYSPATAAGMMDAFLQLPIELIISQSYSFSNRQVSLNKMQRRQNRMMASEDVAISQVAEISEALDMTMSGHIAFGTHHLTIMCVEDDLKTLEKSLSMVIAELVNLGINPAREHVVLEQCYWAQLPGNFEFIGRGSEISTMNVASFASLHNYPVGRISNNHWGNAVTVFDTTSGTPYFFNFHANDVGHTTIIGPTGAGKTVLMNFLVAQAQKFHGRTFMFDKDRGAEIFVRALGGQYSIIEPGKDCGFNPLHLSDTSENRSFLQEWLKSLVTINSEVLTPEEEDRIVEAVEGNYKLKKEDRMLRNIAPFFGLEQPGSIASRFRMWHSSGRYARIFDNEADLINFSSDRVFGFEMGELLADKTSLAPVLMYLFQRVQMSLDGTPTMIILDEAWALIDNPIFAGKIKDWLKTMRKLNGMVVFATQSVEDASKSSISDTLIQQTATQIFLPNPKATDTYKNTFMLTDREFNLLKTTDPSSRYFLVKQSGDVVVARIDLSGMEDVINVLSGRSETVAILDQVQEEVGSDPEKWLPLFQTEVERYKRDLQ